MGASDSESDDEEEADPGESNPGLRLLWCAQYNHLSLAASMLSSNPQLVFTKDSDLYTPLHRAAYSNHTEMLTLLLGAGADPLATTDTGWTALHSAARWDCAPAVELLLAQQGIKVDMKNTQGDTPRKVAERMGNLGQLFDAVMPRGVMSHKE